MELQQLHGESRRLHGDPHYTDGLSHQRALLLGEGGVRCVLHFLRSVHNHFLYTPSPLAPTQGGALKMIGFQLMLLVSWREAEPLLPPLFVLLRADC